MTKTRSSYRHFVTLPNLLSSLVSRKPRKRNHRRLRLSQTEPLEARCCLAAVAFATHDIVSTVDPSSIYSGDVDGDGDLDLLFASSFQFDTKVGWFENTDGHGTFGNPRAIFTSADYLGYEIVFSVYAGDVDRDGDLDVLSASKDKVAWYENLDGKGTFGDQRIIATAGFGYSSVSAGDVDGDGDLDVFSASYDDDKVAWYENLDGKGTFGNQRVITTAADGAVSMYTGDVDGDGDQDVISASRNDRKIAWYENTDGKGTFGAQRVIITSAGSAGFNWSMYAGDVDGDGDLDVLSASASAGDSKIAWYENTDGKGTFGAQRVITNTAAYIGRSVYAGDIDGDGDVDVLTTSPVYGGDSTVEWYENTDGKGTFGTQRVIATAADRAKSVYAGDLDGDGDVDVLATSYRIGQARVLDYKTAWYENTDGKGTFGTQHVIMISPAADLPTSVNAADVDGDGDLDVLSASYHDDKVAWYENMDGQGTFGKQRIITTAANGARSVYASDVDGDGDLDVLSASHVYGGGNTIAWYENTDGKGTFGNQRVITTRVNGARSVYAGDVDGDGDLDVLSASRYDNKVAWYENTDGKGTFGNQRVITTAADRAHTVYAGDVDGDGDLDVLSASYSPYGQISWYENTDAKGNFGPQRVITTAAGGPSMYVGDVDGDGDLDVLSTSYNTAGKITWFENSDGKGTFANSHVVTTALIGAWTVYAGDVDGDGDLDVISDGDNKIAWYENTDGKGTFGAPRVIATPFIDGPVHAGDMDGDGDLDVLSAHGNADKIAWYENLSNPLVPKIGDANDDGIFDSSDLVAVFQAGEYEDGIPQNSTFAEGDWNGDREFDSGDLVLAFQAGTYVSAAQPAAVAGMGSALALDTSQGLKEIHHERTTKRTAERVSQPIEVARRWDLANVDSVFAQHARTSVRGRGEISHDTILEALDGILDEAIL
jgi:hypothetical protein